MNQINFESAKLKLDYITLTTPYFGNKQKVKNLANYFYKEFVTYSPDDQFIFYRILQFLSFVRSRHSKKEILNGQVYYTFDFPLVDFAKQINLYPLNWHQRKKLVEFFSQLQQLPPVYNWFSDVEFRSSVMFPVIRIENKTSKHSKLMISISASESFVNFKYPFHFPNSYFTYKNKNDLDLKIAIIKSISHQVYDRKTLNLEDLLKDLNNQNKASMKQNIINQFQALKDGHFIRNQLSLVQYDNQTIEIEVDQLTKEFIKSTKELIFYENL